MEEKMIAYLQDELTDYREEESRYGISDRIVSKKFDVLIGNKEMIEALIGKPVNLGLDGKVTVGL